ncbi:hypothetical protein E1211_13190 [Micromonospora sp. 15K316]|uniref:hypothetical protein n=1 Tax=Micromonospora sp. 15K316 TaxID=2530376 RepID=UPI00104621DB|nr:hypothetical protein [Micromonospora sp. 15K316]TDC36505.1 hypothetical protein E1211_13190 [Micromonospora sp. 15K316]
MTTPFRRKAIAVVFAVLGLTLAGGGIAIAQPAAQAPGQPAARAADSQPAVTAESARSARAALKANTTLAATNTGIVVNANGTRARGIGTVIKYGPGQYEVQYGSVVTSAIYVATIGRADSCCVPPAGEISVAPRLSTPNAVFVQTRNSAGTPVDLGFHLIVHTN